MRALLLGMWVFVGLACGGGDDDDTGGACGTESPLPGTSIDDIGKLGVVTVQERQPEGRPIERFANAIFMDFSTYDGDAPPTVNFDAVCNTVTGDEVERSPATILDSPSSAVVTIGGQDTELEEVTQGRMQAAGLGELASGGDVSAEVVGGDGSSQFPSFDSSVQASDAPSGMTGELSPNGEFILRWTPAGAEAIEVELWVQNPDPDTFYPVRCIVADDGCLTVSSQAVGLYLWTPYDVRMTASRSAQWDGSDGEIGFLKVERRRDFIYAP